MKRTIFAESSAEDKWKDKLGYQGIDLKWGHSRRFSDITHVGPNLRIRAKYDLLSYSGLRFILLMAYISGPGRDSKFDYY